MGVGVWFGVGGGVWGGLWYVVEGLWWFNGIVWGLGDVGMCGGGEVVGLGLGWGGGGGFGGGLCVGVRGGCVG